MVLRYTADHRCEWISTSAILFLEPTKEDTVSEEPSVRDLDYKKCFGCTTEEKRMYRLNVPGTQLYIAIAGDQVRLEVSTFGDVEKFSISVWTKCQLDESTGGISYTACLYREDPNGKQRNNYVYVTGDGDVTVKKWPQWFLYNTMGNCEAFKVQELDKWLGCDVTDHGTCGKFSLKVYRCFFNAYRVVKRPVGEEQEEHLELYNDHLDVNNQDSNVVKASTLSAKNVNPLSPPTSDNVANPIPLTSLNDNNFNQPSVSSQSNQNSGDTIRLTTSTEKIIEPKFPTSTRDESYDLLRLALSQGNSDNTLASCSTQHSARNHPLGTCTPDSGYGGHSRNSSDQDASVES